MKLILVLFAAILTLANGQNFTLRLVDTSGQPSTSSGLVEIYYEGQSGTICANTTFGQDEANLICTYINIFYTADATFSTTSGNYGTPNASIVSRLDCSSADSFLSDCDFDFIPNTCNSATSAVTVTCSSTLTGVLNNLVGIIVGVVIAFIVISVLCALIPILICCCCGCACFAAGAAAA